MKPIKQPEGLVVWARPEYGVTVLKPVLRIDFHRTHKRLGYVGAWRLTAIKEDSPDELLCKITKMTLTHNRERKTKIWGKLNQMTKPSEPLKPNQRQTFLNFLLKLKP